MRKSSPPKVTLATIVDRAHQVCHDASLDLGKVHGLLTACNETEDCLSRARTSAHRIATRLENIAQELRSAAEEE